MPGSGSSPIFRGASCPAATPAKVPADSADSFSVDVNENLVRDALFRTNLEDREHLLTIVEAYRLCVETARRLRWKSGARRQRDEVLGCVEYCEKMLAGYASHDPPTETHYPPLSLGDSEIVLTVRW